MEHYAWFLASLFCLAMWGVVYLLVDRTSRREMLLISLIMTPIGLTEPFFVPEYWSPPSLFNLALTTGFDIESLIFVFAVCGISAVLYQRLFKLKLTSYRHHPIISHRRLHTHITPLLIFVASFIVLPLITPLNPIYAAFIGGIFSVIWVVIFRKDLIIQMFWGGVLFALLYFAGFKIFLLVLPEYVIQVWNLNALSGILVLGVPIEEIVWGFALGATCTTAYEYFFDKRLVIARKRAIAS